MKTILWVEDDLFSIARLKEFLADRGFRVITAATLTDAKAAIRKHHKKLRLVVLDVMFPVDSAQHVSPIHLQAAKAGFESGLVLARWMKTSYRKLPFICYSIVRDPEVVDWFNENGGGFYSKPDYPVDQLADVFDALLSGKRRNSNLKLFIVHGRDEKTKYELKNYLQNTLKLPEPIILHEQPSLGRTIIEKFEEESRGVNLVFVLLTPDDSVLNASDPKDQTRRARQNVIFELGYFLATLNRKKGKVLLLYKGPLELPSDIAGLIYIDVNRGIEAAGEDIRKELAL